MLSNFKISTKLYTFAAVVFFLTSLIGTVAFVQMNKIGIQLVDIAEEDIPITSAFTQITVNQLQQAVLFERGMAAVFKFKLNLGTKQNIADLSSSFSDIAHKNDALIIELEAFIEQAIVLSHTAEAKKEFTNLLAILKNVEKEHTQYDEEVITILSDAPTKNAKELLSKEIFIASLEDKIDHELIDALDHVKNFTLEAAITAEHDEIAGQRVILSISITSVLATLILAFFIIKTITLPINKMRDSLRILAGEDADLNDRLPVSKDEIGEASEAFNVFMSKLHAMVVHIAKTSTDLDHKSNNAVIMMENSLINIEEQQQQTNTVATAVSQMSVSIKEVSDSTVLAAKLGSQLKDEINTSLISAEQSQEVIESLSINVNLVSDEIGLLASETNRIEEVLGGIKGIADQTNLLALNAAIEAARAGESGRGFAVVADEVRTLAQRTQTSTQDIQKLLESLQQEVSNAVRSMIQGKNYAVTCMEKAISTAESLKIATGAVQEISALNIQISASSEQQAKASLEINRNLQTITDNSVQTTQKTKDSAQNSKSVSNGLRDLNMYVDQLKT